MIPTDTVAAIRDGLRLSQVVSRRVRLRKTGREWVGLCPIHKERSPSFSCDDQKGLWHCFGCGEGGDVIEYCRKVYGWSFLESCEALAKEAGVEIPQASPEQAKIAARRLSDLEVIERVRIWYEQQLQRTPDARTYLKKRGVSDGDLSTFAIGYAPAQIPYQALAGRSDHDELSRTGLVVAQTGAPYFQARVTFPIRNIGGRTVGFGGRSLTDISPKYLNTPETELFHKGSILYGADLARQPCHEGQDLYVVEGYLDVIACHSFGLPAVAPMGTSLTESQLLGLWRLSDRPIIAFDGDAAGRAATRKALNLAFKHLHPGLTVQTVKLPQGRDPGSYLGSHTPDSLKRALGPPMGLADAFWLESTSEVTLGGPDKLAHLESMMVETLRTIPNAQLREKYIQDARQRIRTIAQPKPIIRANGHTLHSTNPATRRLLSAPGGMTIKQALEIVGSTSDHDALHEAQALLAGVGLWQTKDSNSSSQSGNA